MNNFLNKIKNFFRNLYARSYGMDDINRVLLALTFVSSIIELITRSTVIYIISTLSMIAFIFRYFSSKKFARSEENRKFRKIIKLFKTKWTYRKTHRVFMCKNCGQLVKIPKGHGKVIVTCPNCNNQQEHNS
ncbi:MAG: hypothetical protein Q4E33_04100 [Erysipelotrichaceae bacterium]|nr:hypothetical protein [Erysipelotrichaceae bacterium]